MTFSDEETSVVEIEDDSYGSGDCSPGHYGAGQSQDDQEPAKESEGDNVSNSSNLNIEKAEARNKKSIFTVVTVLQLLKYYCIQSLFIFCLMLGSYGEWNE